MKHNTVNIALALLVSLGISACKTTTPPGESKATLINPAKPGSNNSGNSGTSSAGTNSSSDPSKPSDTPAKPSDTPSKPSDKPSVNPTTPSDNPDTPTNTPSIPSDAPSTPSNEPTTPPVNPSVPPVNPNSPSDNPNTPSSTPSEPADTPPPPSKPGSTDDSNSNVIINLDNAVDGSAALKYVQDQKNAGSPLPTMNTGTLGSVSGTVIGDFFSESGTVVAGYAQNYTTYAVIRNSNSNRYDHVIQIEPGKHTKISYKDQLAQLDATYQGKLSTSIVDINDPISIRINVYDADMTLQLKNNTISGTAKNNTYGTSYTFNNAPIVAQENILRFKGTFKGDISSGTYQGAFAGENAQEVVGRLDGTNSIGQTISGAFAATKQE